MSLADNLEKLLTDGQDNAMLRFGLGSAYFNDKDFIRAIPHLQACLAHDPEYTAAYKLLGKALYKTDQLEAAKTIFEAGLPMVIKKGDKQTEKEMSVFLKKINN